MRKVITHTEKLVTQNCCQCGTPFAIEEGLDAELMESHGWFFCPIGHQQQYVDTSDRDKAQKALRRAEAAETRARAIQDQLAAEAKAHSATKGQLTKTKKRVGNGTCPCCNRHFSNVERHMATKHPEYANRASETE